MKIFRGLPVIPQDLDLAAQLVFIRRNGARLTESPKVLSGIEAVTAHHSHAACFSALVFGAMRLAGILHYRCSMPPRDCQNWIHVSRLPKQVHGYDCLSAKRDRRLKLLWIERVGLRIDIHKDRLGAA